MHDKRMHILNVALVKMYEVSRLAHVRLDMQPDSGFTRPETLPRHHPKRGAG